MKVGEKFCEVYATFKYYNPVYFDVHLSFVCWIIIDSMNYWKISAITGLLRPSTELMIFTTLEKSIVEFNQ